MTSYFTPFKIGDAFPPIRITPKCFLWSAICFPLELGLVAISCLSAVLPSGTPMWYSAFLSKVGFETSGDFKSFSGTLKRYPWSAICFPLELGLVAISCLSAVLLSGTPMWYSAFLSKVGFETSGDFKSFSGTLKCYPWSVICFLSELRFVAISCLSAVLLSGTPMQYSASRWNLPLR
jgi:hypothetical protein